ncbi:diguanylate cyclase (GGDEF)-like protein [Kineococcus xinjiangensis]|uniref:Diguanylate cyclase (GGDEF)-like protein n=1 Tax=Kineococcus xinjiangensis TaxID=512762 RepID=A0A2S6IUI6_9ACTN|nr:EAL domain-containing protein [Kineococcus xinjiangensis]PPK97937.1 diguanylate cyclase (GGDEF)-like protein [Kineococcus xinjiangensis]
MNQQRLTAVLAEFARTLVTDYPVQAILEHLVRRVVEVLPVSGAGVMLTEGRGLRFAAASDDVLLRIESLQDEVGEGPCLEACRTGQPVLVPDLAADERFPRFAPAALEAGMAAVFTFPLRWQSGQIGALDLYSDVPYELSGAEFGAAQILADVAAAYVVNARSRDELSASAAEMEHRSLHDPLTGLANRALLLDRLTRALLLAERSGTSAGVLFLDLDAFKAVNDAHGHRIGDLLLLAVAERMQSVLRPGDTLARLGGDEFVVVCEGLSGPSELARVAERVALAFRSPFLVEGREVGAGASIGTAMGSGAGELPQHLLEAADRAMYLAKRPARSGGARGGAAGTAGARSWASLEQELAVVVAEGSLEVAYQPVVDLATASWVGVEALVRWPQRLGGHVDAAAVVAAAERAGLIVPLGAWVLGRACADVRSWSAADGVRRSVAVNVSGTQLRHPAFAEIVEDVLVRTGTPAADLCLEISPAESADGPDPAALRNVHRLRDLGVRIAVDGFASRHSAFGPGGEAGVDVVKIARSYVGDLGREPVGEGVVASILGQAARIDLRVVAEGIETAGQLERLRGLGCSEGQGFLLGRPRSLAELRLGPVVAAR